MFLFRSLFPRTIVPLFLVVLLASPSDGTAQIIDSTGRILHPDGQISSVQFLLVRDTAAQKGVVVGAYRLGATPYISTDSLVRVLADAGYAVQPVARVRDTTRVIAGNGTSILVGGRMLPADRVARFLAENGFAEAAPPKLGLSLGISLYQQLHLLRGFLELGVTIPPYATTSLSDQVVQEVQFDALGVQLGLGVQLPSTGPFDIVPFISLGIWNSNLTINRIGQVNGRRIDSTFDGIFHDTAAATYALENSTANINVGLGAEYNFPFSQTLASASFLALGLRAEYAMGISNSWNRKGRREELPGGPDMSTSEFNFWVTMTFKTRSFPLRFQ